MTTKSPYRPDYVEVAVPRRPVTTAVRRVRTPVRWEPPTVETRGSWKLILLALWFGLLVLGGVPVGIAAMFTAVAGVLASQL
jgi:hypothetical protein